MRAASKRGVRLRDGIAQILKEAGIKAQVTGFELMFHVGFGLDAPARNYRDLLKCRQGAVCEIRPCAAEARRAGAGTRRLVCLLRA